MERQSIAQPASASVAADLGNITHGWRWWNWLTGRSAHPWIDRSFGRIALRMSHLCGKRMSAAWPGPLWSRGPSGTPMLSWFVAPVANACAEAFVITLNSALEQAKSAGNAPEVQRLMQRVVLSQASTLRRQHADCPAALLEPGTTTRVMLIDERARSTGL